MAVIYIKIFSSKDPMKLYMYLPNLLAFSQIGCHLPTFLHLLRRNPDRKLTVKQLVQLLKPEFSLEGSMSRLLDNTVYVAFIKYIREVASTYT